MSKFLTWSLPAAILLMSPQLATAQDFNFDDPLQPFTQFLSSFNQYGVNLRGAIIDEGAGNPRGGVRQGGTNVGQAQLGADLNLDTLFGIRGGFVHVTGFRDYGNSLSLNDIGVGFKVQEIYRNPYNQWHFGLLTYEQRLLDDHLRIEVGRTATARYYGQGELACRFVAGTLCGITALLNSQSNFSLLPSATWGGNIRYQLSPNTYVQTGAFEVNPYAQQTDGLDWSTSKATGVIVPVEVSLGTSVATNPYPYNIKIGGYYSNGTHPDPYFSTTGRSLGRFGGTAATIVERSGMYMLGNQVVWRDGQDSRHNIAVLATYVQPFNTDEVYARQATVGFVWNGPFQNRPEDWVGFSSTYYRVSTDRENFLNDARARLGSRARGNPNEFAFELNYGMRLFKGAFITPNLQYIVNPDNSVIPRINFVPKNALIVGIRAEYKFGDPPFSGLERLGDRQK